MTIVPSAFSRTDLSLVSMSFGLSCMCIGPVLWLPCQRLVYRPLRKQCSLAIKRRKRLWGARPGGDVHNELRLSVALTAAPRLRLWKVAGHGTLGAQSLPSTIRVSSMRFASSLIGALDLRVSGVGSEVAVFEEQR